MNPRKLFLLWSALVVAAFTIPRFFAPADGVDLAPLAGLVSLGFLLAALVVASATFAHTMSRRKALDHLSRAAGIAPFVVSVAGLAAAATAIFG